MHPGSRHFELRRCLVGFVDLGRATIKLLFLLNEAMEQVTKTAFGRLLVLICEGLALVQTLVVATVCLNGLES